MNEEIGRIAATAVGVAQSDVRVALRSALEHQRNRLYDVWVGDRHLIAKEYVQPGETELYPRREYDALALLAALDIAPQPVFFDPTVGPIVLYEYMPGEMWDRRRPSAADLTRLAELWLLCSSLPTEGLWLSSGYELTWAQHEERFRQRFEKYRGWAVAHFAPGVRAIDLCLEQLARQSYLVRTVESFAPVLCFCRSDTRFANVIERPDGRLGWIDWEDSGLRDPALELTDVICHVNQEDLLTWEEWQPLIQMYIAARQTVDPGIAERMHVYLAIFPLFWLSVLLPIGVQHAESGTLSGWRVNEMEPQVRLRRLLARALVWPKMEFERELAALEDLLFFPEVHS